MTRPSPMERIVESANSIGDIQPPISMKERCLYKFHVIVLVLIDFQTFLNKGKGKKLVFYPFPILAISFLPMKPLKISTT